MITRAIAGPAEERISERPAGETVELLSVPGNDTSPRWSSSRAPRTDLARKSHRQLVAEWWVLIETRLPDLLLSETQ